MNSRINSIQWLRAIAAIAVAFHHEFQSLPSYFPAQAQIFQFLYGTIGVDVFFCLSGFVMVFISCRPEARFSPGDFLVRRLVRVAPVYWLLTLAFAAVYLAMPTLFTHVARDMSMGHLIRSLAFIPDGAPPVLFQGWTLSFEMLFYLIFSGFRAGSAEGTLLRIGLIFAALVMAGQIWSDPAPLMASATNPLLLEFVFGMGIATLHMKGHLRRSWLPAVAGTIAAVFAISTLLADPDALNGVALGIGGTFNRIIFFGIPAVLFVVAFVAAEESGRLFDHRLMLLLGECSYSLYLTHVIVEPVFNKILLRFPPMHQIIAGVLAVSGSILVAIVFYYLIERPTTVRLNRYLGARGERRLAATGLP